MDWGAYAYVNRQQYFLKFPLSSLFWKLVSKIETCCTLDTCYSHDSITGVYHNVNNVFQIYGKYVKYTLENIIKIVLNVKGRKHVGVLCISNLVGYYQSGYFSEGKNRKIDFVVWGVFWVWVGFVLFLNCILE